jgi:hypothetical protein
MLAAGGNGNGTAAGVVAKGGCKGALPQAASVPTIRLIKTGYRSRFMRLLLLEALGALLLLVLIVWWTMFSGRDKGELPGAPDTPENQSGDSSGGDLAKQVDQLDR